MYRLILCFFMACYCLSSLSQAQVLESNAEPVISSLETSAFHSKSNVSGLRITDEGIQPASYLCQDGIGSCNCPRCCLQSEGTWQWIRDEEQERRRAIRIYNLHCVRCHGVVGRGVWDIPDVPNFANARWQSTRTDNDLVRLTLNGRGACMPAFKGTITIDEAYAIARYIRTFAMLPPERPDFESDEKDSASKEAVSQRSLSLQTR
ncbi:MAG: cytochrome c [Planctomycetales bacterium]|nr:cytochrome c [Planctomycetales bacterium]